MTISRCIALRLQPRATNSVASQSSSSGWRRPSPIVPKSLGVATIPRPKWCCQRRLTITRAVSGLSGRVSQSASAVRRPLDRVGRPRSSEIRHGSRGRPGTPARPRALWRRYSPRRRRYVGGGSGPGSSIPRACGSGGRGLRRASRGRPIAADRPARLRPGRAAVGQTSGLTRCVLRRAASKTERDLVRGPLLGLLEGGDVASSTPGGRPGARRARAGASRCARIAAWTSATSRPPAGRRCLVRRADRRGRERIIVAEPGGGEERLEPVEVGLADRVELVVVAAGAADRQAEEDQAGRLGDVVQRVLAPEALVVQVDHVGIAAVEARGDERREGRRARPRRRRAGGGRSGRRACRALSAPTTQSRYRQASGRAWSNSKPSVSA